MKLKLALVATVLALSSQAQAQLFGKSEAVKNLDHKKLVFPAKMILFLFLCCLNGN